MNAEAPQSVVVESATTASPPATKLTTVVEGNAPDFCEAFARAQASFGVIKRTRTVTVQPRESRPYSFTYAPLDEILAAVLPPLNREGFSLTQRIGRGTAGDYIETTLMHASGERKNQVPIFVTGQGAQQYGSGITYARRYGITLLLGVAAEEDDDGNQADGNKIVAAGSPKAAAAPVKGKDKGKGETHIEYEPGESRHTAPIQQAGKSMAADLPLEEIVAPKDEDMAAAEGRIADAIQEFHEAAIEGRRVGIEQIWAEIRSDQYVAQQTWRRLQEQHPDSFATVSAVLHPKPTGKVDRSKR